MKCMEDKLYCCKIIVCFLQYYLVTQSIMLCVPNKKLTMECYGALSCLWLRLLVTCYNLQLVEVKHNTIFFGPVTGHGGLQGCEMFRITHSLDSRLTGGSKVDSIMHWQCSTPQKHYISASGTHFCYVLSKPCQYLNISLSSSGHLLMAVFQYSYIQDSEVEKTSLSKL
jgi:hypothetical protein